MRFPLSFVTAFSVFVVLSRSEDSPPSDEVYYDRAAKAQETYCKNGWQGKEVNRDASRQMLYDIVGHNFFLEVLEAAADPDEIPKIIDEELTIWWMLSRSAALVLGLVLLLFWPCCVLSVCCRFREPRFISTPNADKCGCFAMVILVTGGAVLASFLALEGVLDSHSGFENTMCQAATVVDSTLTGTNEAPHEFVGLATTLDALQELGTQLEEGSALMLAADMPIAPDSSEEALRATEIARETLVLLEDAVTNAANRNPESLKHVCKFCEGIQDVVASSRMHLDADTVALKLAMQAVEEEKSRILSSSNRESLQGTLQQAAQPIQNLKDLIVGSVSWFIHPTVEQNWQEAVEGELPLLLIVPGLLFFWMASILLCSLLSTFVFWVHEKTWLSPQADGNPYSIAAIRCSRCTWCCGYPFAVMAFLIGGLMIVSGTAFSGACLILEDGDYEQLERIAPALGIDLEGRKGRLAAMVATECLHGDTESQSFMDLVAAQADASGQTTFADVLANHSVDVSQAQFTGFDSALDQMATSAAFGDLPSNVLLRGLLRNYSADHTMVLADSEFGAYADLSLVSGGLTDYLGSTGSACDSLSIASDVATVDGETFGTVDSVLAGNTYKGVRAFARALENVGTYDPADWDADESPCSLPVDIECGSGSTDEERACRAGRQLFALKREVRTSTTFRCDLFEDPSDPAASCDPQDMSCSNGLCTGDCLEVDGGVSKREELCNLQGLAAYLQDFDGRLARVFDRRKSAVEALISDVTAAKDAIREHVVDPLYTIEENGKCTYLAEPYQKMIDGLCYQSILGLRALSLSYVVLAAMSLALTLVLYGIWRRESGNYDAWEEVHVRAPAARLASADVAACVGNGDATTGAALA